MIQLICNAVDNLFCLLSFVNPKDNCKTNIGAFEIVCYNRFLHFCQAIDFQDSTIMTVTNGAVQEPSIRNDRYERDWNTYWKENGPIGNVESLKDNLVIGLIGRDGSWTGKILLLHVRVVFCFIDQDFPCRKTYFCQAQTKP